MVTGKKIAVYTAIMGGFDSLQDPLIVTPGIDYICFTDNKKLKSKVWNIKVIEDSIIDSRKIARNIKINPHLYLPTYEYSIWVDGNILILKDLTPIIEDFFYKEDGNIATFKHFSRNCIYEEALVCSILKKDTIENIYKQIKFCVDNKYPTQNGLAETNVIFRKHQDRDVVKFMELWWDCVDKNSIRDQLSFNIISFITNIEIFYLKGNARFDVYYFRCKEHKKRNIREIFHSLKARITG